MHEKPVKISETRSAKECVRFAKSVYIWLVTVFLVLLWFPFVLITFLRDRDPLKRKTTRAIRRLNMAVSRANPLLDLDFDEGYIPDPNQAYIIVANHQSVADVPLVSNVPVEVKWVAKDVLFNLPFTGWMMRMAGDIPVHLRDPDKMKILQKANVYLQQGFSVVFFPEGRRSLDGHVYRFSRGAFELAAETGIPILPVVVDGLHVLLPMNSWKFGNQTEVRMKVLEPVETTGLSIKEAGYLRERVRFKMMDQLAEWREVSRDDVDGILRQAQSRAEEEPDTVPLFY